MANMFSFEIVRSGRSIVSRRLATLVCATVAMLAALRATLAQATPRPAGDIVSEGTDAKGHLTVMVNKTAVLTTRVPYKRVSIGQPDVADVNPIGPGNILVTGKKMGTTQIIIWDDQDRSQVIDVLVDFDLQVLQDQLKSYFPDSKIEVANLNGAIALRGRVTKLENAEQAAAIASPFAPKVLNFLELGGLQQIMLQVRFAEVSRGAISNLGVNTFFTDGRSQWGFQNGPGGNPTGALASNATFTFDPTTTVFGSGHFASISFEYFLSALKNNNLARVLAEPNVTVRSGEEANFLAGGEIPVPVPQSGSGGGTTITIEYKQFGVKLNVVPVAMGDGRIRMKVVPEVSQLDFSNAVTIAGTQVPAITKRTVSTNVELGDGQTFAIAGLLNDTVQATRASTPYLGDIPIIGTMFRSVRYERKETELLVLVTPRVVAPLNPDQVPTAPGERWRHPTDTELFWFRDIGAELPDPKHETAAAKNAPTTSADAAPARFHGNYGFVPSTQPAADAE